MCSLKWDSLLHYSDLVKCIIFNLITRYLPYDHKRILLKTLWKMYIYVRMCSLFNFAGEHDV